MNCKYCGAAIDLKDIPAPQPISIDAVASGRPTMGQPITRRNAVSKVKMVAGLVVILFCLLGSVGYAQGELTLEGLAERVEALIKRVSISDTRLSKLETRVATLESSLLSAEAEETPTPIAMKTGKATGPAMTSEPTKKARETSTTSPSEPTTTPYPSTGATVDVGHVRWRILSAEHLGNQIEFEDETDTTLGGFVSVRFEFLNSSSDPLKFDGGYIRDGQGREYSAWSGRWRFVPDGEDCWRGGFLGLGDFRLKPNAPTICTVIYEVAGDASDFIFVATDLEGPRFDTVELIDLGLSETTVRAMSTAVATERDIRTATAAPMQTAKAATRTVEVAATQRAKTAATRRAKTAKTATRAARAAATQTAVAPAKMGEDVRVDEVRWRVLSAEDLGNTLSSSNMFVDSKTTAGRFVRVRFEIENLSNDLLTYGGVDLVDNRGREYASYSESFMFLPDGEECYFIENLNPNIPKICTVIYEVAADAADLKIVVSDLRIFGSGEKEIDLGLD